MSYGVLIGKAGGKMGKARNLCKADKKELKTLADEFGLLGRKDVQEAIKNSKTYAEGQRAVMRIYTKTYME